LAGGLVDAEVLWCEAVGFGEGGGRFADVAALGVGSGDLDVEAGLAFWGQAGGVDSDGDVEGFAGVAEVDVSGDGVQRDVARSPDRGVHLRAPNEPGRRPSERAFSAVSFLNGRSPVANGRGQRAFGLRRWLAFRRRDEITAPDNS
jgi:hypothetical protein